MHYRLGERGFLFSFLGVPNADRHTTYEYLPYRRFSPKQLLPFQNPIVAVQIDAMSKYQTQSEPACTTTIARNPSTTNQPSRVLDSVISPNKRNSNPTHNTLPSLPPPPTLRTLTSDRTTAYPRTSQPPYPRQNPTPHT